MPTHSSGTALAPHRAPSNAPAIAATVSVSWPIPIAVVSVCCRCRHGMRSGTAVCVIDDQAAWSAPTTQPFSVNAEGGFGLGLGEDARQ